jgi:uncharacterized protein (DUF2147 family)
MAKQSFRSACAILLLMTVAALPASSAMPGGTWMFANSVALQFFDCSGLLCGKIVWLLRPDNPAGQPDLDYSNPDPALRQRHLCGLTIIWGMQSNRQDQWSNGSLYDPKEGITYNVTAELTSPSTITARVYRGTPLLGRTEILTRDPPLRPDGRC